MRNKIPVLFILLFSLCLPASPSALFINEVMPANLGECIDSSWNFGGWVELYNPTATAIPLDGTVVSDHKGHSFTLGPAHGSVPAHGYKNLWFGHYDETNFPAQIDFKLDCDGGTLTLSQGQRTVATVSYPAALPRNTWARTADGADSWSNATPTPEASNSTATFALSRTAPPVPDLPGGWLDGPLSLNVYAPEGADLYYTTDGTVPTTASKRAKTDADGNAVFSISATTCYRFRCYKKGTLPSSVITRSFISRTRKGSNTKFCNAMLVSVTTNPDYLYDDQIGIYVTGTNGGWSYWIYANYYQDWDRPVNVEIFDPEGLPLINQEVDMCMSGGRSRYSNTVKNFKLKSSKKYEGATCFPVTGLFPDKPYLRSKDILLRTGGPKTEDRQKDIAMQTLVRHSGFYADTQDYRPTYVFFNGKYQDMIFLREPSNKHYGYANYGYDTDYMDTIEESDITGVRVTGGNSTAFDELCNCARNAANSTADWERVTELLDVDNFANYFAVETYLANKDWPQNNIKMFRSTDDGRFHVLLQDLDACLRDNENTFTRMENNQNYGYAVAGRKENTILTLFLNLMKREEFRQRFVTAYCLVTGSVFQPDYVKAQLAEIYSDVEIAHGQSTSLTTAYTHLANTLSAQRQDDRFGFFAAWKRSKVGKYAVVSLTAEQPAALLLNGQPVPRADFNGPLVLPATVEAQAPRGYRFTAWLHNGSVISTDSIYTITHDGSYKAVFATQNNLNLDPPVVINEICASGGIYQSPSLRTSDWIELFNTTATPIDLTGTYISDDLSQPLKHTLPKAEIPAYGHLILWADNAEGLPFKLSNATGEGVILTAPDHSWSDTLRYVVMSEQQTVGRFPDGGTQVYLLDRPTIAAANLLTSYATRVSLPPYEPEPDGVRMTEDDGQVSPNPYGEQDKWPSAYYDIQGRPLTSTGTSSPAILVSPGKKYIGR